MPRHTRVPQRGVSGAAKFHITPFFIDVLLHRVPKMVISIKGAGNFFRNLKGGAANKRRLKNTGIRSRP